MMLTFFAQWPRFHFHGRVPTPSKNPPTSASSASQAPSGAVARGGRWGLDPSEALTCALARRMKLDMLDAEQQHTGNGMHGQFAQMDRQLRAVEQLREQRQGKK